MQKAQRLLAKPAAVAVLLAVVGVTAHAGAILMFTSRDAFQSYVGPPQFVYNFNGLPNSDGAILSALNIGPLGIGGQFGVNDGALEFPASPQALGAFNFSSGGAYAWGADIETIGGPGQIELLTGGRQRVLMNVSGPGFVGFASDRGLLGNGALWNFRFTALDRNPVGITDVRSVNFLIDNVIVNAVPEPTTLLLLGAGAGLAAWSHRRRSRRDARDNREAEGERPDVR